MAWIFAHQGGWDEFLMFAIPVALGWWAIKAAEKRSRARASEGNAGGDADAETPEQAPAEGRGAEDR